MQRIRYVDNETHYCAGCQNGGELLADRAMSRLFGADWPPTVDDLEMFQKNDSAWRPDCELGHRRR